MIVSHEHRYVFLHIPKTAGTSIEVGLGLRTGSRGGWVPGRSLIVGETKHHIEPAGMPRGYLVFTFVRNPWDRILSYFLFRREPRNEQRRSIHPDERTISLRDWLLRLEEFGRYRYINPAFDLAIGSQSALIRDYPEFIGRYENLQADFSALCVRLGIEPVALSNVNPTTRKSDHYSRYFDDDSVNIVAKRYRDDIERFGYSFEDRR